jgi:alpha-galactosidase
MTLTLKSPHVQLIIDPKSAAWSLYSPKPDGPSLDGVSQYVRYRRGRKKYRLLTKWPQPKIRQEKVESPRHGSMQQASLEIGPDIHGLQYTLTYAVPVQHPVMLWKISISHQGTKPVNIQHIEMLSAGFFKKKRHLPQAGPVLLNFSVAPSGRGAVRPHPDPGELGFFSNGWQSWSHTGAFGPKDRYRNSLLDLIAAQMWYNPGTPRPTKAGHFASDMFGVLGDRLHRAGILAGFLSQKQHFGSLMARVDDPYYPALRLWANGDEARLDPGAEIHTDWACIQFIDIDDPDPLGPYLEAVARENSLTPHSPLPVGEGKGVRAGWCSWYQFFNDINEDKIRANLRAAAETQNEIPLNLIQIDDGFEAKPGDWLEKQAGFPEGVGPLANEIKAAGYTPGLWLGPFILHSGSKLARKHRNWLLRNKWGLTVNAGFVWNNFTRALDLTHPEALAYAKDVIHMAVHEWGYPYLKLDFLYAAALKGLYHDRTKTRAQVLRMGLETLRQAAGPEVELLGCGVPLGSGLGIFDAMRIGADVAQRWLPEWNGRDFFFPNEPNMPSTRNALQNTLTRAFMHRRWWVNDPDCLLIRPDSQLTLAEVQSLATAIALSGGAMLLSDDLPNVPPERLRIAQQLLPLIGKTPRVLDWFDEPMPRLVRLDLENETGPWHLLAVFNWDNKAQDVVIPLERLQLNPEIDYLYRSFWDGHSDSVQGGALNLMAIPPHGVRLLTLRSATPGKPQYLGSDLHISQGLEVTQWSANTREGIRFSLERPGQTQGQIELYLPEPPQKATCNQNEITWQTPANDLYTFDIRFERQAELRIE